MRGGAWGRDDFPEQILLVPQRVSQEAWKVCKTVNLLTDISTNLIGADHRCEEV